MIASIGEFIDNSYLVVGLVIEGVVYEIRANEPRTTCNEQFSHMSSIAKLLDCFAILVGMKIVIESGYFNPLHGGHLDMIEAGRSLGDKLIVVVNNDQQQMVKKGKIILDEANRLRLMRALRDVDEVILSVDTELPINQTLGMIARRYPDDELVFANGGDRDSEKAIPEVDVCHRYGIKMVFGVGGNDKADSSTRINQATGHEDI